VGRRRITMMVRVLAIVALCGLPYSAASDGGYEVRITGQRSAVALDGTVGGDGRTWSFHIRDDRARHVEFRTDGHVVAQFEAEQSQASATVRLGAVRWTSRDDRPPATARAATDLETAIAIREAAIKLADVAPEPEYRRLRLAALE